MNTESMRQPITLDFSEQSFAVRPFTVDQVLAMEELFGMSAETATTPLKQSLAALRIALSEDHPDVDPTKIRASAVELARSLPLILAHAGFTEPAPGEAPAAA